MKKFTVSRYETLVTSVVVEAESEDEAARLAEVKFDNQWQEELDSDVIDVWYEYSEED